MLDLNASDLNILEDGRGHYTFSPRLSFTSSCYNLGYYTLYTVVNILAVSEVLGYCSFKTQHFPFGLEQLVYI
jgi:hypothetical protein